MMPPNRFFDMELDRLKGGGYSGRAWVRFWRALRSQARAAAEARPELRRELGWFRLGGAVVALLSTGALLAEGVPPVPALAAPVLVWLLFCAWVGVELGLVRHPVTDEPSGAIGPANLMTLYRGWAAAPVALIGGTLARPTLLWVLVCLSAGLTDLADGTVARRLRQESRLGRLLDPVMDACFFNAAALGLWRWRLLPGWVAGAIALRYFSPVVGGISLMLARGRTLPVAHTPWGQRSTLLIGVALLASWLATMLRVPVWALGLLYAAALLAMLLALLDILRRVPADVRRPL